VRLEFRPSAGAEGRWPYGSASWHPPTGTPRWTRRSRRRPPADVAVLVVGSAETTESEGFDRETLRLPGRQDELIERVSSANPRTVVGGERRHARCSCPGRGGSPRWLLRLAARPGPWARPWPTSCSAWPSRAGGSQ